VAARDVSKMFHCFEKYLIGWKNGWSFYWWDIYAGMQIWLSHIDKNCL